MTNSNSNFSRTDSFASQRSAFAQRRFRSRQRGSFATDRSKQKQPASTYFELLWSLPARKTLPELMQASS